MSMTKREKQRITAQENTLIGLGFSALEAGKLSPIADREKGAKKRLHQILESRNYSEWAFLGWPMSQVEIKPYIQGDPRGAALYLIRPDDVPEGKNVDSYYSRGICVY